MSDDEVLSFLEGIASDTAGADYYENLDTGLEIQEGHFYRREDGDVVGPARWFGDGWAPWLVGRAFYHGNGVCPAFGSEIRELRLVEEVYDRYGRKATATREEP